MNQLLLGFLFIVLIVAVVTFITQSAKPNTSIDDVINMMPAVEAKIKTIEEQTMIEQPEIQDLNDLVSQYIATNDPLILIQIGDIWRKGAYSRLQSSNETAIKYYDLAASSGNKEVATLAIAKYIEAKEEDIQEIDNVGQRLNDIYFEAVQAANAQRPVEQRVDIPVVQQVEIIAPPLFLDDTQNVHDHYMNRITKHNIDKLKTSFKYNGDTKTELINAINDDNELTIESKATVLKVIRLFTTRKHKYFDCNEMEALELVYLYIKQHPDSKTLLHNLFLQLLDCYSSGMMVCPTGKISRIISVVGDTDEFEDQRNIYYIKRELESLAFKVRDDQLKKMSLEDVDKYNNGSELLADQLKAKYIEIAKIEYCDKLGIQYNIISPMIEANLIGF